MPANLTPEYKAAEAAFRRARDPQERLEHLQAMLRAIPKHKGTEHLQADIKARIKELTTQLAGPRKTGARTAPPTVIRPEGAAQVALLGPPNSGKSALHAALTGSHAVSEPYPFATQYPLPGMMPVHDVGLQLIDLPSIAKEHPIPWIGNAVQPADAALFVIDLTTPGCLDRAVHLHELLAERRVFLTGDWSGAARHDDPFAKVLPVLLVATKADQVAGIDDQIAVFEELTEEDYPALAVSTVTGDGLDKIGPWLFDHLGIVRVYTKKPGQPPDMSRPFTVRRGETVLHVARLVHKDVAANLKYARLWGTSGAFDGQQVGPEHVVVDGDILELHT
jgi:ribosome-interacting GTPase 1